jgi:hypothetical protein
VLPHRLPSGMTHFDPLQTNSMRGCCNALAPMVQASVMDHPGYSPTHRRLDRRYS